MCRITLTGNFCAVPTECVKLAPELHTCFSKRFWWAITHSQRKTYSSFTWYLRFPVFTHLFGIFCHQFSKCVHNRCPSHETNVTSPHKSTTSLSILRPDPLGEQDNTDFEPDICAVIDIDHAKLLPLNWDIHETISSSFGSMMLPLVRHHT